MDDQVDRARAVVRAREEWIKAKAGRDESQMRAAAAAEACAREERVHGVWDWIAGRTRPPRNRRG